MDAAVQPRVTYSYYVKNVTSSGYPGGPYVRLRGERSIRGDSDVTRTREQVKIALASWALPGFSTQLVVFADRHNSSNMIQRGLTVARPRGPRLANKNSLNRLVRQMNMDNREKRNRIIALLRGQAACQTIAALAETGIAESCWVKASRWKISLQSRTLRFLARRSSIFTPWIFWSL